MFKRLLLIGATSIFFLRMPVEIAHADGVKNRFFDQKKIEGLWNKIDKDNIIDGATELSMGLQKKWLFSPKQLLTSLQS